MALVLCFLSAFIGGQPCVWFSENGAYKRNSSEHRRAQSEGHNHPDTSQRRELYQRRPLDPVQHPSPDNHDRRMKNVHAERIVRHELLQPALTEEFFAEQ